MVAKLPNLLFRIYLRPRIFATKLYLLVSFKNLIEKLRPRFYFSLNVEDRIQTLIGLSATCHSLCKAKPRATMAPVYFWNRICNFQYFRLLYSEYCMCIKIRNIFREIVRSDRNLNASNKFFWPHCASKLTI